MIQSRTSIKGEFDRNFQNGWTNLNKYWPSLSSAWQMPGVCFKTSWLWTVSGIWTPGYEMFGVLQASLCLIWTKTNCRNIHIFGKFIFVFREDIIIVVSIKNSLNFVEWTHTCWKIEVVSAQTRIIPFFSLSNDNWNVVEVTIANRLLDIQNVLRRFHQIVF